MSCRGGAGNRAKRTTELTLQSHFVLAFDELQGSGEFVCSLFIPSDSYFRPHASSFHIQEQSTVSREVFLFRVPVRVHSDRLHLRSAWDTVAPFYAPPRGVLASDGSGVDSS